MRAQNDSQAMLNLNDLCVEFLQSPFAALSIQTPFFSSLLNDPKLMPVRQMGAPHAS